MWIEVDGLAEVEKEGVIEKWIRLLNLNSGVQILLRKLGRMTEIEKGVTQNMYQIILRLPVGIEFLLKTPGSQGEAEAILKRLKEGIEEKEGKLFKL